MRGSSVCMCQCQGWGQVQYLYLSTYLSEKYLVYGNVKVLVLAVVLG